MTITPFPTTAEEPQPATARYSDYLAVCHEVDRLQALVEANGNGTPAEIERAEDILTRALDAAHARHPGAARQAAWVRMWGSVPVAVGYAYDQGRRDERAEGPPVFWTPGRAALVTFVAAFLAAWLLTR